VEKELKFYIDFEDISYCFPYCESKRTKNFGVLDKYRNKLYSIEEINEIIAELITKIPYISGAMDLNMTINYKELFMNIVGYHHILSFKNYDHHLQKITDTEIKFLNP
jgi:hypothetical protein